MNIFILDKNIATSVASLCDKHVVKMTLETAQIVSSAIHHFNIPIYDCYLPTHINHPCVTWASSNLDNLYWLTTYGLAISDEYSFRYNSIHKSTYIFEKTKNYLETLSSFYLEPKNYAIAITSSIYKGERVSLDIAVQEYISYYISEKKVIAKYNNGRLAPLFLATL